MLAMYRLISLIPWAALNMYLLLNCIILATATDSIELKLCDLQAFKKLSTVSVLMTGLREELMGKIKKATVASNVLGTLTEESESTERRVRVKEGSRFVTITAISRNITFIELSLVLEIIDDFFTVNIIAMQKIVRKVTPIVLMQT